MDKPIHQPTLLLFTAYPGYGNFSVKLKTTNASACTTEQAQMVTVVPKPVATFDLPFPAL